MRMQLWMIGFAALAGCSSSQPASCGADDLDCFMSHLVIRDSAGNDVHVDFIPAATINSISAATHSAPQAPLLTSGPPSVSFPYGTQIEGTGVLLTYRIDLGFTDPNGCEPVVGLALAKNGKSSAHTGCFPGLHDHRMSGTLSRTLGFTATAPAGADFDSQMVVISSADCAYIDNPLQLVTANGAHPIGSAGAATGVFADNGVTIPLTIAPPAPPSSSGGSCTAAWDCGSSTQCASVMGGKSGTAGPFASLAACNQWRQTYFAGAVCSSGCQ